MNPFVRSILYVAFLPIIIFQPSCYFAGTQASASKGTIEQTQPEAFNLIKLGPEFEFDLASGSSADVENSILTIQAVKKNLLSQLDHFSQAKQIQESQVLFQFNELTAQKYGFGAAIFRDDYGINRLQSSSDLKYVGKLDYFSIDLYPTTNSGRLVNPLTISYTKDDVLFEVKVSPLNITQLDSARLMLDTLIFQVMGDTGLVVPSQGGGHMHIGLDSFFATFKDDQPKALRSLYNFMKVIYESDRFSQAFLRPHNNYAILPSMVSDLGRQTLVESFDEWKASIESFENTDRSSLRSWLTDHLHDVTLSHFLDEVQNGSAFDELTYFFDAESSANNRYYFSVTPEENSGLYPAIRYNNLINTIEIRALKSQRKMDEFIEIGRLFTRILVHAGEEDLSRLRLANEMPRYQEAVPLSYVNEDFVKIMKLASYTNDSREVLAILRALRPNIESSCP